MNKRRRKELEDVLAALERAKDRLEVVRDDEREAYEALPEQFQQTERAEKMEEIADLIDEAIWPVEEAIDAVQAVLDEC